MLSHLFKHAVLASSIFSSLSSAQQQSKIIPQALQVGFANSNTELQVSYTGDAVNGFADGTVFEKNAVSKLPEFALGDASGISSQRGYVVLMVDTTCASSARLHYARANFRYNFQIVKIESQTTPALAYQAPGAFGETGDQRQYSFLMYEQPGFNDITSLKIPANGQAFDAQTFKSDNGLQDPVAGVGMVVKLGGQTNCDGQTVAPPTNGGGNAPPAASSVAPPAASSVAPPASSAPPAQSPTSSVGGRLQSSAASTPALESPQSSVAPSATPSPTSAVRQTPAVPSSSAASASQSTAAVRTSQPLSDGAQAAPSSSGASNTTSRGRPVATITSTVLGSAPSTLVPSGPGADETPSSTASAPPQVQTDSAATEMEVKLAGAVVLASAVVFAGLLVW